jgi:hypothetical protein
MDQEDDVIQECNGIKQEEEAREMVLSGSGGYVGREGGSKYYHISKI